MNTVKVNKDDLLKRLKSNREEHMGEFSLAQTRYRQRVIETLDKNLAAAKGGRKIVTHISLPVPVDYTADYDAAIEALEWEVADEVELDMRSFRRLVRNEWEWQENYRSNTQAYTTGALQ